METINKVLEKKKLEELQPAPVEKQESQYAELTEELVGTILSELVEGKSAFQIRKDLLKDEGKSIGKRTIRLVDKKRKEKIAKLTPKPEEKEGI